MILHRRYTHYGIRVLPNTRKNNKFEKMAISLKINNPDSKADFWKKSLLSIRRLVLSVWHMTLHIQHIVLSIKYIKRHIQKRY